MAQDIRPKVAQYIKQWGGSSSIALLDPSCQIFSVPSVEGIIGYREGKKCAVVIGDPVCAEKDRLILTKAFEERCKEDSKSIVYAVTSQKFKDWALMDNVCSSVIQVGEELILDPQFDPTEGSFGRRLRNKLVQAKNDGVTIHEYLKTDPKVEQAIENVGSSWLKGRQGPQIYLANLYLFADRFGKRWFYAEQNGKIIGALLLNQLEAYGGWLFNLLMTDPNAPTGTSELLVVETLAALRNEGCRYVTCGVTPPEKLGEITGLGKLSCLVAKSAYKAAKKIFHLEGRKKYWEKFLPKCSNSYILFNKNKIGISDVMGILKAFNAAI